MSLYALADLMDPGLRVLIFLCNLRSCAKVRWGACMGGRTSFHEGFFEGFFG